LLRICVEDIVHIEETSRQKELTDVQGFLRPDVEQGNICRPFAAEGLRQNGGAALIQGGNEGPAAATPDWARRIG
jgi:hypothetical protein